MAYRTYDFRHQHQKCCTILGSAECLVGFNDAATIVQSCAARYHHFQGWVLLTIGHGVYLGKIVGGIRCRDTNAG